MKNIIKAAIVMAIMMSATFAFGQGTTDSNSPTGGNTVYIVLDNPFDVSTYDITYRWKTITGWTEWQTVNKQSAIGLQSAYSIWTPYDAIEFQYQISAKKAGGKVIGGTGGTLPIINHVGSLHITLGMWLNWIGF